MKTVLSCTIPVTRRPAGCFTNSWSLSVQSPPLPPPRSLEFLPPTATAAIHSKEGAYGSFVLADLIEEYGRDGTAILVFVSDLLNDKDGEARHTSRVRDGLKNVSRNVPVLFFGSIRESLGGTTLNGNYNYAEQLLRSIKQLTLLLPTRELLEALGLHVVNGSTRNSTGSDAIVFVRNHSIAWVWDGHDTKGRFNFDGLQAAMEAATSEALEMGDDSSDTPVDGIHLGSSHPVSVDLSG